MRRENLFPEVEGDSVVKITVTKRVEIEVDAIHISVPVRYDEEDIPNDFPLRVGDLWEGTLDLDTGRIREWPEGQSGNLSMKVTDCGTYRLMSGGDVVAAVEQDYVPSCIPGRYGDYIDLDIDEHGVVTNWRCKDPHQLASAFVPTGS